MQVFTDKQMDLAIGKLLRFGVIFSAIVVTFGGVLYLHNPSRLAPSYVHFTAESTSLQDVSRVLRGAAHLDANSVIQLGLLFLIATPLARVAYCVVGFARQQDRLYVAISFCVLLILIYSLVEGGR